jgi:pimeloyl-ACP methyl ester carboxylesterase
MRLLATPGLNRMATLFPSNKGAVRMITKQIGHGASLRQGNFPEVLLDWNCALMNNTNTMRSELGMIERGLSWRGGIGPGLEFKVDELAQIEQPTLFLWGEDDPFGSPELGRRLAEAIPRATIQVYANSGHLPWLDQPEEHAAQIYTFLCDRTSSAV